MRMCGISMGPMWAPSKTNLPRVVGIQWGPCRPLQKPTHLARWVFVGACMDPIEITRILGKWVFGVAYVGPIKVSPYGANMDNIFRGPCGHPHMGPTQQPIVCPYILVGGYLMGPTLAPFKSNILGKWVFGGAYVGPIQVSPHGAHKGNMDNISMGPIVGPYGHIVGPIEVSPYGPTRATWTKSLGGHVGIPIWAPHSSPWYAHVGPIWAC